MYVGNRVPEPVRGQEQKQEFVDTFNYLGSTICYNGGVSDDIHNRLSKARSTFMRLKQVWKSSQYSTKTNLDLQKLCIVYSTLSFRVLENGETRP